MVAEARQNHNQRNLTVAGPEWRLLVLTARLELDEGERAELLKIIRGSLDWDLLLHNAFFHGTTGLIYRHVKGLNDDGLVQNETMERLKNSYLMTTVLGMEKMAAFKAVAEELEKSGVDVIVLKGVALAETMYGDIGLRPFGDVDLLVKESDWPEIVRILREKEYYSLGEEYVQLPPKLTKYDTLAHMQYMSGRICLEFQFDLLTLGIGMRDIDGVWKRARKATVAGASVLVLSPEDQLLHLAVHANRHGCMQLKWLVDIAETLRQSTDIDWDLVVEIARRERIVTSVYSTILHTERLLGHRLLRSAIIERLRPRSYQRVLWKAVWPEKQLDGFQGRNENAVCFYFYRPLSGWNLINFAIMGRIRDKLAYQARWIVPSLTWMSQTYDQPKRLSLLAYYSVRVREVRSKKRRMD